MIKIKIIMSTYNISQSTLWVVGGFLLATLVLGLYAGRGIKDIKDYALGNTRFSTITLVLTLIVTATGGHDLINYPYNVYKFGIIAFSFWIGITIQSLLVALFIAPKVHIFKNCITIGDFVGQHYGKYAKILTGILLFIRMICITSIQFISIGKVLEFFFHINIFWGVIISGSLLGLYTAFGGIKSVTYTDILQFILLIITVPLISSLLFKKIGNFKDLYYSIPADRFEVFTKKEIIKYLSIGLLLSFSFSCLVSPSLMQRVFMANSKEKVRNMFLSISAFNIFYGISLTLIGLACLALYPNIKSETIIFQTINKLFFENHILKGLVISGVIAVIMSSADSYLHVAGLILFNDLIKPIFKINNKLINLRIVTAIAGITFAIISLNFINTSFFKDLDLIKTLLNLPILIFPIIFAIFGIKSNSKIFFFSALVGFLTVCICFFFFFPNQKIILIGIGMLANAIAYMISHIIQNKGIAWVKVQGDKNQKTNVWVPNSKQIFSFLISLIPTPKSIYNYSKNQVMKNGAQNILFGIYACINFTLVHYLWDHHDPYKYNLMITLRFIGGVMAALLIVKDKWYDSLKPYFSLYWHLTLTYCLPFITTVMFLLSDGSFYWLNSIAVSIFYLIMLVAGEVFLILAPLGVGLGLIFYKYYIGPVDLSLFSFDINFNLFSQILFPTIIGLLFAFNKRISNILKGNIGLNLGSALCHEIKNTLYSLTCNQFNRARMKVIVEDNTRKVDGKDYYLVNKDLFISFLHQTNEAINFDEDTLKVVRTFEKIFKDYKKELSNPKVYSMSSVVNFTLKELHFLPGQKEKVKLNLDDDFYAKIPKSPFAFVISNIIRNAFKHGRASEVLIKLENHRLIIRDNGVGVPFENLERIFRMHYTTGQRDSTGIGLGFAKLIVNSCFGEIWCESDQGENSYSEFIIQFPEVSPSEVTKSSLSQMQEDIKMNAELSERELFATRMLMHNEPIEKIQSYTLLSKHEIIEIEKKI